MAIKVTTTESKQETSKPFPKLMKSRLGSIVFFQEEGCGVCILKSKTAIDVGEYSTNWDMGFFTDYN